MRKPRTRRSAVRTAVYEPLLRGDPRIQLPAGEDAGISAVLMLSTERAPRSLLPMKEASESDGFMYAAVIGDRQVMIAFGLDASPGIQTEDRGSPPSPIRSGSARFHGSEI